MDSHCEETGNDSLTFIHTHVITCSLKYMLKRITLSKISMSVSKNNTYLGPEAIFIWILGCPWMILVNMIDLNKAIYLVSFKLSLFGKVPKNTIFHLYLLPSCNTKDNYSCEWAYLRLLTYFVCVQVMSCYKGKQKEFHISLISQRRLHE